MASLEKIRKHAGLLVIVIGAGLLAFILEEGVRALGFFGNDTTIVKVGGEKIDYTEFSRRSQQLENNRQNGDQDAVVAQMQLLDNMIDEDLVEQEGDNTGVYVTDKELSEYVVGNQPMPDATNFAQAYGYSPADLNQILTDFKTNPAKFGDQAQQLKEISDKWDEMVEGVQTQVRAQKLNMMLVAAINPNDLDLQSMKEDGAEDYYVQIVKKDYSSVSDSKYPVSDADLKAQYEKDKEQYRLTEPVRRAHYIAVDIVPSRADLNRGNKRLDSLYTAFSTKASLDSLHNLLGFDAALDSTKAFLDNVNDAKVKSFLSTAAIGQTIKLDPQNDNYTMYRLMDKVSSLDTITYDLVMVQGDKKVQDSVLNLINGGKTIDQVSKTFKGVQGRQNISESVAMAPDSIKAKIAGAPEGKYSALMTSADGASFIKVTKRNAPKTLYTMAVLTYTQTASNATKDNLRDKLQQFVNKNQTTASFVKNAAKAGYLATEVYLTQSTPQLGGNQFSQGISNSRKAIKWVFDNKAGQVSQIFNDNPNELIVVAIDDVYDGDYIPYNAPAIKDRLTQEARNAKKGAALMQQYNGKASDINGYARILGSKVDTASVNFAMSYFEPSPSEPGIIGRIAASKPGKLQGLWQGKTAVYAYVVTKVEKNKRVPSKEELQQRYAQSQGYVGRAFMQILTASTKIKKNITKFM